MSEGTEVRVIDIQRGTVISEARKIAEGIVPSDIPEPLRAQFVFYYATKSAGFVLREFFGRSDAKVTPDAPNQPSQAK